MRLITTAWQLSLDFLSERFAAPARREPQAPPRHQTPDLDSIWNRLRLSYFPAHESLKDFRVVWSTRKHRNTLASCSIETKRILVAGAMSEPRAYPFIEPLLFHEMCHAVLGKPERKNGRRVIHGSEFKQLEKLHPGIADLDRWISLGGWHSTVRNYNRKEGKRRAAALRARYSVEQR